MKAFKFGKTLQNVKGKKRNTKSILNRKLMFKIRRLLNEI